MCTVDLPAWCSAGLSLNSSRQGGNITHFAKLLSKSDRDVKFVGIFYFFINT